MNNIILILLTHWVFDFVLQTDEMALEKGKNFWTLVNHSIVYSLGFLVVFGGREMFFILLVSHIIIDGISSRVAGYFYKIGDRHNFFVVIGLDQVLHYIVLIWIFGGL